MAETRKHRPRSSFIGDQVRASVDSGPRPVNPGEFFDPFVDETAEAAEAADQVAEVEIAGFGVTSLAATEVGTEGWYRVEVDALQQLVGTSHAAQHATQSDDDDYFDDELDDELDDDEFDELDEEDDETGLNEAGDEAEPDEAAAEVDEEA